MNNVSIFYSLSYAEIVGEGLVIHFKDFTDHRLIEELSISFQIEKFEHDVSPVQIRQVIVVSSGDFIVINLPKALRAIDRQRLKRVYIYDHLSQDRNVGAWIEVK